MSIGSGNIPEKINVSRSKTNYEELTGGLGHSIPHAKSLQIGQYGIIGVKIFA
jgi:hypothetical protein